MALWSDRTPPGVSYDPAVAPSHRAWRPFETAFSWAGARHPRIHYRNRPPISLFWSA